MMVNLNDNDITDIQNFNIDTKNREIYLHSYFDSSESGEPGVDYRSAVVFEKNVRYLNTLSHEPILVHMHLPGGEWQDCLGIYDTIKFSKSKIILLAYAKVESSSSVVLQAAPLRILMPNVTMLIHYGSFSLNDEHSKAAASSVKWNEEECDKMVDIFSDRCMESEMSKQKNWKKMMAKKHIVSQLASKCDWLLKADDAVEYGFADGVLGSKKYPNIDFLKSYKFKK
jgi:ATP-dependent protease ClpP protease subunit